MRRAFAFAFTILLFAATVLGQSSTGRLVGTVSDASGVLPGATVVVKDTKTGKERTVTTSDDGSYSVAQLEPGTYTVIVSSEDTTSGVGLVEVYGVGSPVGF